MADQRGATTIIYGAMLLTMLTALGLGMDLTNALQVKAQLDLAADSAAIACSEDWQATMTAGAAGASNQTAFDDLQANANNQAQQVAKSTFAAQAAQLGSLVNSGYPTATTVNNAVTGAKGATVTCTVTYMAASPTYLMQLAHFTNVPLASASASNVELTPYVSVYLILDTSASMMVGSTPADQAKVATWVANNQSSVLANGDTTPCAFACHDTTPFTVSNLQQGETVAAAQGALTRFDVMKLALVNDPKGTFCGGTGQSACDSSQSEGLLAYIRDNFTSTNARANLNTFVYSVYGFNEGINGDEPASCVMAQDQPDYSQYSIANQPTLSTVAAAINKLTIGLDTHLNPPVNSGHKSVLDALTTTDINGHVIIPKVQTSTPAGQSTANPLVFVIIVTDGMSSDRNWNWNHNLPNNCDNVPSGVSHPASIATNTWCSDWGAASTAQIPMVDGTLSWQGNGGNQNGATYGLYAQCQNKTYTPGFQSTLSSYTQTQQYNGYNSIYYAQPLNSSYCTTLKNVNGATVAVLETPYVPLTGQDQGAGFPYEGGVQSVIYPNGDPALPANITANQTQSTLSAALQSCATNQSYYFSAVSDAAIASGFIQLFNTYVGQWVHLTQ